MPPFAPQRRPGLVRRNLLDIAAWAQSREVEIFRCLPAAVVVPGRDRVLDPRSMHTSAEQGGPHVEVVTLPELSHFVILDKPEAVREFVVVARTRDLPSWQNPVKVTDLINK